MADSYRRLPDEERFQTGVVLVAFFSRPARVFLFPRFRVFVRA